METVNAEGLDTLASLEQRIQHAVEILSSLRRENERLAEELKAVKGLHATSLQDLEDVRRQLNDAETQVIQLSDDVDGLREERKQVKSRIEKLLGQMDALSAN